MTSRHTANHVECKPLAHLWSSGHLRVSQLENFMVEGLARYLRHEKHVPCGDKLVHHTEDGLFLVATKGLTLQRRSRSTSQNNKMTHIHAKNK